jgi:hypothetical protein
VGVQDLTGSDKDKLLNTRPCVLSIQRIIAILDDEAISEDDKPDALREALGSMLNDSGDVSSSRVHFPSFVPADDAQRLFLWLLCRYLCVDPIDPLGAGVCV